MAALGRAAGLRPRAAFSYLVLRYSLIAATGILFYLALLRMVASERLAAAFSLSLVLFDWFGWEIHHSVSHTLALLAAALALWIAALAYADQATARRGFLLGLIIGVVLMAEWSFLLVVLSLGVALAMTPETRRVYSEPRTLLVLAGAALPMLPFALWLAHTDPGLVGRLALPSWRDSSLAHMLEGASAFITRIPLVFLPWIVFVLLFAWRFPKTPTTSERVAKGARRCREGGRRGGNHGCLGARAGKTWRQSPGVPLNTLRSTDFSIPGT
ncbi:MAG TPA: hypothetical protein VGY14_00860 [Methyloceanibacter sp.]|jgi:4-amino-4-deoxy-L-arabinose transferase-like glycosyltransferase|nr:hypothetical protein [Methyloceanibacter sp.]